MYDCMSHLAARASGGRWRRRRRRRRLDCGGRHPTHMITQTLQSLTTS